MKDLSADRSKIVVISWRGDVHVPFVAKHLKSEVVVVDASRILEQCELSYLHDGAKTIPIYDGKPLTNVKSVWYRRPYIPERDDIKVPDQFKDYCYTAIRKHAQDLYTLLQDAYWPMEYHTMVKSDTKPRQLEIAASVGFRTPKTLTTSSAQAAAAFITEVGTVVTKSMASTLPVVNDKVYYFYTTKLRAGETHDFSGLHVAPSIFQEAIDAALDLRITVVGEQVFAASIADPGQVDEPAIRDWRRNYTAGAVRCKRYNLPPKLKRQCIALTKALGLTYGAIDLILDTKGDYWFLEINSNGQWAFVEEDTGLPIGKAIAELLERAGR
jgi:glutathione synthase/RimK-type ligase-like ATP-grasp enzyme